MKVEYYNKSFIFLFFKFKVGVGVRLFVRILVLSFISVWLWLIFEIFLCFICESGGNNYIFFIGWL